MKFKHLINMGFEWMMHLHKAIPDTSITKPIEFIYTAQLAKVNVRDEQPQPKSDNDETINKRKLND